MDRYYTNLVDENELCAKVSKIDPKIRFSGLINNKGRLIAGGMIGSVKSLEDEKEDEMLFMELALRVKMRQEFDKDFGKVNFTLSHREKLIVMSFPFDKKVLFVSMDKRKEFDKIPFKILKLIEKLD
ncbi:MAG: hypothetical protein CMO17_03580 [Thaumarchaeota archaeon]|nr:hypothetical protein [Nitrososphaerota archaeon]